MFAAIVHDLRMLLRLAEGWAAQPLAAIAERTLEAVGSMPWFGVGYAWGMVAKVSS